MWPHLLRLLKLVNSCWKEAKYLLILLKRSKIFTTLVEKKQNIYYSCWKEAKYLLLFCIRNFMLPILEITSMFLGNINEDLSMSFCLPPDNRRTYLNDIFVSMLSDFVFGGDVHLFYRNVIMNYRSEICRVSARKCFEVTDCNFFLSLYIVWCYWRIPTIRTESLCYTTTWMLWKQLPGVSLMLNISMKN
jgi:hypothetical protein